jgi:hypothetical protein
VPHLVVVGDVPGVKPDEPALIQTGTGRLSCIMRNDTRPLYHLNQGETIHVRS